MMRIFSGHNAFLRLAVVLLSTVMLLGVLPMGALAMTEEDGSAGIESRAGMGKNGSPVLMAAGGGAKPVSVTQNIDASGTLASYSGTLPSEISSWTVTPSWKTAPVNGADGVLLLTLTATSNINFTTLNGGASPYTATATVAQGEANYSFSYSEENGFLELSNAVTISGSITWPEAGGTTPPVGATPVSVTQNIDASGTLASYSGTLPSEISSWTVTPSWKTAPVNGADGVLLLTLTATPCDDITTLNGSASPYTATATVAQGEADYSFSYSEENSFLELNNAVTISGSITWPEAGGAAAAVITLTAQADANGSITEWMLKGDANRDGKVSNDNSVGNDITTIEYSCGDGVSLTGLAAEAADVNGDGFVSPSDVSIMEVFFAAPTLPNSSFTFRVIDTPNVGYETATVKVNGNALSVPAKGKTATTTASGVTYTVEVSAAGVTTVTGQSLATNEVKFTHKLIPTAGATFNVYKTLKGGTLTAGQFTFKAEYVDMNGKVLGQAGTAKNDARGVASFTVEDRTDLEPNGLVWVKVSEVKGSDASITYDDTFYSYDAFDVVGEGYPIHVGNVTDGVGQGGAYGNLADAMTFENTYNAQQTGDVTFTAKKTLKGGTLAADQFTFKAEYVDMDGNVLGQAGTAKNDADGVITFTVKDYTSIGLDGLVWIKVSEVKGSDASIIYDDTFYSYDAFNVVLNSGNPIFEGNVTDDVEADAMTFENTYNAQQTGDVTFTAKKTLKGGTLAADQFTFKAEYVDMDGNVLGQAGTAKNDANGVITFTVKDYTSIGLDGLVWIKVSEVKGSDASIIYDDTFYSYDAFNVVLNSGNPIFEGNVTDDVEADAMTFENKYVTTPSVGQTGELTVTKTVTGRGAPADATFAFTFTFSEKGPFDYTLGNTRGTVASGGTLRLAHGQSATITLPQGVKYSVTESSYANYAPTPANRTISGTISATPSIAAFRNAYEKGYTPPSAGQTGNLTVKKTVMGDVAGQLKSFTFTIRFDAGGSYGYIGSSSGSIRSGGKISLRHGEYVTIIGLPAGTSYSVTESGNNGYRVYASGDTGVIRADSTSTAAFTNSAVSEVPQTGDGERTTAGVLAIAGTTLTVAIVILLGLIAGARRRRRDGTA